MTNDFASVTSQLFFLLFFIRFAGKQASIQVTNILKNDRSLKKKKTLGAELSFYIKELQKD